LSTPKFGSFLGNKKIEEEEEGKEKYYLHSTEHRDVYKAVQIKVL